jgi:hypothetical protein
MRAAFIIPSGVAVHRLAFPSRAALAFLVAAGLVAAPALAQQKGDQWEISVKMDMQGMSMPQQTVRMCLDKRAKEESYLPQSSGECKVQDVRRTGNTVKYRMECGGKDPMVADGEMTWAGDSYSGRMKMKSKSSGEAFEMSQVFSGRKVGECANPVKG